MLCYKSITYIKRVNARMEDHILKIKRKNGATKDDGYKTFSIRIRVETVERLDALSEESKRSRNELINILLDYGLDNTKIVK